MVNSWWRGRDAVFYVCYDVNGTVVEGVPGIEVILGKFRGDKAPCLEPIFPYSDQWRAKIDLYSVL